MIPIPKRLEKLKSATWFRFLKRYKALHALIPAAVVAFVFWQGRKQFRRIDWHETIRMIHGMSKASLALQFGAALAAVAVISGYDFLIRRHFRFSVPPWATFRYAWIANTTNSVIGFAGIAGVGLRTILYRQWDVPISTIAAAIAYLSTITITGLSLLAWAGILGILPIEAVLHAHPWILYVVWADALFLPAFVVMQRTRLFSKWFNKDRGLMDWGTIAASVGISLLEWMFAGFTFWLIASNLLTGLTFAQALGIFTVAAVTGLVSMAPGGIGSFDLTALLGLGLLGHDPGKSAAVLVLYRLLYYLVPWVIGLVMAAFEFTLGRKRFELPGVHSLEKALNPWQRLWHWPGQFDSIGEIGAWALGNLVFASGFLLLLSAAVPNAFSRLRFADELLSFPLMRLSHGLSVVIGLILIVLSWGISHRVRRAFWWTMAILAAGVVFTFTRAFDVEEAVFLFVVLLLLWVSRGQFNRMGAPFDRDQAAKWGLVTLVIAIFYAVVGQGAYPFVLENRAPWPNPGEHAVTAAVAVAICWIVISLVLILRPGRRIGTGAASFQTAGGLVSISYSRFKNILAAFGDPKGPSDLIQEAVKEFKAFADRYSYCVVYYRVASENLRIYKENGYELYGPVSGPEGPRFVAYPDSVDLQALLPKLERL